jgi:hypothetical protein
MLLTYLAHSFRISSASATMGAANPRSFIIQRTFNEMYNLRGIAGILVQLPLNNDKDQERAGPPFQIPYTMKLPAEEADCWRLHLDLIEASSRLQDAISGIPHNPRASYAATLHSVDSGAKRQLELLAGSARRDQEKTPAGRKIAV